MLAENNNRRSAQVFDDNHAFTDDLLGKVHLNQLERDCIDTPEYRRLFHLAQLGLVDRLYHTANHTRGIHSIGVCVRAKRLVDNLNHNTPTITQARKRRNRTHQQTDSENTAIPPHIGDAEKCLISLAGLLHDLPHTPFSHDLEKKSHRFVDSRDDKKKLNSFYGPYPKHDDYVNNPALYLILFDTQHSVLARVLQHHSPAFWQLLQASNQNNPRTTSFLEAVTKSGWNKEASFESTILTQLLFHLLVFDDIDEALENHTTSIATHFHDQHKDWGLGPHVFV